MSTPLNRFLTSLDASFLYFEKQRQTMHIGSCMVYEGDMPLDQLRSLLLERLHLVPRYRQRVVFPPFSASHPLWIDDPAFDIDNHLAEVILPDDISREELSRAIADAYSGMLERNQPLWFGTILRNYPGGNTGVVWKVHHAMIDGVSGVDLTMAINEYTEVPEPPDPPAGEWRPADLPEMVDLWQEAFQHRLTEVSRTWTDSAFDMLRPNRISERAKNMRGAMRSGMEMMMRPMPKTPFNSKVSGQLDYAWSEFSFTEMRRVKSSLGGTINDLVLTILGGSLRRYLKLHGHKVDGVELRAMCPVSMRMADEHGQLGNLVSVMGAPVYVGIEDPLERLAAVRQGMDDLKETGQAESFYEMTRFSTQIPPFLQVLGGSFTPDQAVFNTVSTNVPGPQIPLYQAGHRCVSWLPLGIVSSNIGLFHAILTYNRRLTIGMTVDPKQIPDVWVLADCLTDSYEEIRALAGVEPDELDNLDWQAKDSARRARPARSKADAEDDDASTSRAAKELTEKSSKKSSKKATKKRPRKKTKTKKASKKTTKKTSKTGSKSSKKATSA